MYLFTSVRSITSKDECSEEQTLEVGQSFVYINKLNIGDHVGAREKAGGAAGFGFERVIHAGGYRTRQCVGKPVHIDIYEKYARVQRATLILNMCNV